MSKRKYDLVLYGATGFTGKLTAAYLDNHPDLEERRWAIAGRNQNGLEAVRAGLSATNVDVIPCPLTDSSSVEALASSTHAVITTAGPFSAYDGDKLLGACAKAGTHYSDLSGEGFWQREMIDQYHDIAQASGAKIVLGGGVDSIPSDLGTMIALQGLNLAPETPERVDVTGVYTEYSGSFSGGTIASGKARLKALRTGRLTKAATNDPYILAPDVDGCSREAGTADGMPKGFRTSLDSKRGALFSFFMGKINAPVVRRSLALSGRAGTTTYRECCSLGTWTRVGWLYASRGMGYPLGDPIKLNPKPGEGPPGWMIKQGAFTIHVTAETESGRYTRAVITGKGDPGYGATSKMLAEVGLCLGQKCNTDNSQAPIGGGVLTPATGLGDALIDQLANAESGEFMKLDLAEVG